jgi:hypothetical protein
LVFCCYVNSFVGLFGVVFVSIGCSGIGVLFVSIGCSGIGV